MNLIKFIKPENIIVRAKASDKWELLDQMLDHLITPLEASKRNGFTVDELRASLREREERQSTGLGKGIAFPHARIPGFKHIGICIAILDEPLAYDAVDDQPVKLACMLISPEEEPGATLKIWGRMAKLLSEPEVKERLLNAQNAEEVLGILMGQELNVEYAITAKDIMAPTPFPVHPHEPIRDISYRLMKHKEPAVAVTDPDGTLVGELKTDDIFKYGMPDFFNQLQSVSFIKHFNPLEKYFSSEHDMVVADIMNTEHGYLPPTGTLLEIIFLLVVKKHTRIYIVENNKLVGVVSRNVVLDRVINF